MATLAALLAPLLVQGSQPQSPDIRIRPTPDPVHLFVAQELDTKMKSGAVEFQIDIDLEWDLELRFREPRADGRLGLDVRFEHTGGVITSSLGGRTEFDSEDGKDDYPGLFNAKIKQLKMLAGRTLTVALTPLGRVEEIRGYADIYRGTPLEEELRRGGELLTDESFRDDIQSLFALLPEPSESSPSRWEAAYPVTVFEDVVTFQPRFQLVESGTEMARWSFVTTTEDGDAAQAVGDSAPRGFVSGADVKSASLRGESVVALRDGLPLRHTIEMTLEIGMKNPFGGPNLPGVVKQHVEVRRTEQASGDKPPAGGGSVEPGGGR